MTSVSGHVHCDEDRSAIRQDQLACSKRSDSGKQCEVKKAIKSRGGLGSLLRTAPHYLNAWNKDKFVT